MPTSSVCLRLLPTYTWEAGSSPTSTVARPGPRPAWAPASSVTCSATASRTSAATALPSITVALKRATSHLLERGVVGHQLALGRVGCEPHHDHLTRLDPGHHA